VVLGLVAVVILGVVTACGNPSSPSIASANSGQSPEASPSSREIDGCLVTIPQQPGFVPPKPYPLQPPDLYQSVWYGSAPLWTMVDPDGEVWQNLPDDDDDGKLTQKTFWWSEAYPATEEPYPPITLTGRRLDRPGSFETGGPAGGGFREDIGDFILVGLEIPAGCWELTATYRGAELSYVLLVKD
jgi:hypothetical protein